MRGGRNWPRAEYMVPNVVEALRGSFVHQRPAVAELRRVRCVESPLSFCLCFLETSDMLLGCLLDVLLARSALCDVRPANAAELFDCGLALVCALHRPCAIPARGYFRVGDFCEFDYARNCDGQGGPSHPGYGLRPAVGTLGVPARSTVCVCV